MKHITGVMHFFISLELMLVTTCVLYLNISIFGVYCAGRFIPVLGLNLTQVKDR